MRCNFCGRNLTNYEEEYEDDSDNSSDTVNSIEYLLIYPDRKCQTPYGYLWFAVCDGREHVLTSEHKQVTITEIIWQMKTVELG
jgi:hypothetical protein